MTDFSMLVASLSRQREDLLAELGDIDSALRRVAEGRYGLCDRCGQTIDAKRLTTYPATSWCRACKLDYERRRGIVEALELIPD